MAATGSDWMEKTGWSNVAGYDGITDKNHDLVIIGTVLFKGLHGER
jgi:hypothetical protein